MHENGRRGGVFDGLATTFVHFSTKNSSLSCYFASTFLIGNNVKLTDDGVPFDPTSVETDSAKAIGELQIGGMGIGLLRRIVDELHYQRTNERNQLTIIKYLVV